MLNEAWLAAAPSILLGVALLILPAVPVIIAGWGVRSLTAWLFAPAISIALLAVSATVASLIGVAWSLLPVAALALVAAAIAFLVRRRFTPSGEAEESHPRPWAAPAAALVGIVGAAIAITIQLARVFGEPENISQTFDNVVHLNAIRLALDTADASVFTIGRTSDIGPYPNGWHSVVTLVVQLGGATIPVAVNASNIAIFAVAWPVSMMALGAVAFRSRPAALVLTGALSTGFGAFPILLLDFGVLYPNATGYAILPAGVAAVWMLLRGPDRMRSGLLVLVMCAGIILAHPNAFLSLYALTAGVAVYAFIRAARLARTRRAWLISAAACAAVVLVGVCLWTFGRTGDAMSKWGAWQSTAQAFGEAALIAPRGYPITPVTALLLLVGLAAFVARPARWVQVAVPFAAASLLFIAVSGVPAGSELRDILTNAWYSDSHRLAALLPAAGIPVAVLGGLVLLDAASAAWRRASWSERARFPVMALAGAAVFSVAVGANAETAVLRAQPGYMLGDSSALLTEEEYELLTRLDETVPEDALLVVNPWNGGSLAYPLADRDVHERHIFGTHTRDEEIVNHHLKEIDENPEVCGAVARLGADYVLDFGSQNVFNDPYSGWERAGLNDIQASEHLVLVDSEGSGARLFEIVGCE